MQVTLKNPTRINELVATAVANIHKSFTPGTRPMEPGKHKMLAAQSTIPAPGDPPPSFTLAATDMELGAGWCMSHSRCHCCRRHYADADATTLPPAEPG